MIRSCNLIYNVSVMWCGSQAAWIFPQPVRSHLPSLLSRPDLMLRSQDLSNYRRVLHAEWSRDQCPHSKEHVFRFYINHETISGKLMNKHFDGSCELLSLNLILMLTSLVQTLCNQHANFVQSVYQLCAKSVSVQVPQNQFLCKCTQNQLTV